LTFVPGAKLVDSGRNYSEMAKSSKKMTKKEKKKLRVSIWNSIRTCVLDHLENNCRNVWYDAASGEEFVGEEVNSECELAIHQFVKWWNQETHSSYFNL
jgi:hypothetical protein